MELNQEPINKKIKYFLSDEPTSEDSLGTHHNIAKSLFSFISENQKEYNSIIIGMFGPWGCGKSSILKKFEKIAEDNTEVVPIKIDAWKKTKQSFLRDFIRAVARNLILRNLSTQQKLRDIISKVEEKHATQETNWNLNFVAWLSIFVVGLILFYPVFHLILFPNQSLELNLSEAQLKWIPQVILAGIATILVPILITFSKKQIATSTESLGLSDPVYFKNIFRDLLNEVPTSTKQLCIIIDNLDRCDPDESLEIMRKIKTFVLDEEERTKINFIIACDNKALIKHLGTYFQYNQGEAEDKGQSAKEFLRKFFNITIQIPSLHHSDMLRYIDEQLAFVFERPDSYIFITDSQRRLMRQVIYTACNENPRQIKQFINQIAARLYSLRDQELSKSIRLTKPTKHPEAVSLYLACEEYDISFDSLASSSSYEANPTQSNIRDKLSELNIHPPIKSILWATIALLKDPENRHRWNEFSDIMLSIEKSHFHDFKKLLFAVNKEERSDLVEVVIHELREHNKYPDSHTFLGFLLHKTIEKNIEKTREITSFVISIFKHLGIQPDWGEEEGASLGSYLVAFPFAVDAAIKTINAKGNYSARDARIDFFQSLIDSCGSSTSKSLLSEFWTRTISSHPSLILQMSNYPDTIKAEHIDIIQGQWSVVPDAIASVMMSDDLEEALRKSLIRYSTTWPINNQISQPTALNQFADKGGLKLLEAIVCNLDQSYTQLGNIDLAIQSALTHSESLSQESSYRLLYILDKVAARNDLEALRNINAFINTNKESFLQNILSKLDSEKVISFIENASQLVDQPLTRREYLMAISSSDEKYHTAMTTKIIPNDCIRQTINHSTDNHMKWLDSHWEKLPFDQKRSLQNDIFLGWSQGVYSESFSLSAFSKMLLDKKAKQLTADRYDFLVTEHVSLLRDRPNDIEKYSSLLSFIEKLTQMTLKIPEQLKVITDEYMSNILVKDLDSKTSRLRKKWNNECNKQEWSNHKDGNP